MEKTLYKISRLFHNKDFNEGLKLCKSSIGKNLDNPLIYKWFKVFSKYNLYGPEKSTELLRRVIKLFPQNNSNLLLLAAVLLYDDKNFSENSHEAFELIEQYDKKDPREPIVYYLRMILYQYNEDDNAYKFLINFRLFLKYSTNEHFLIIGDSEICRLLKCAIGMGGSLNKVVFTLDLVNRYINKILYYSPKEIWEIFDNVYGYFEPQGYIMDSQYSIKFESAIYKYESGLYAEALIDAEVAYEKCENNDMDNPDLDLIYNLIFNIKICLNDFDWLANVYEDRIRYFPKDVSVKEEYAELCIDNNKMSKAEELIKQGIEILQNVSDDEFRTVYFDCDELFTRNFIIQCLIILLVDSLIGQNKLDESEQWLRHYLYIQNNSSKKSSSDMSFFYKKLNQVLANRIIKSDFMKN